MGNWGLGEILTTIGLILIYSTALVKIYIDVKVKLKELDVKIVNLQADFIEHKTSNENTNAQLTEQRSAERFAIFGKMDLMLEKITDLRINQGIDSKAAHVAVTAAATAAAAAVVAAVEQGKIRPQSKVK